MKAMKPKPHEGLNAIDSTKGHALDRGKNVRERYLVVKITIAIGV